jgi:hypothetical protein
VTLCVSSDYSKFIMGLHDTNLSFYLIETQLTLQVTWICKKKNSMLLRLESREFYYKLVHWVCTNQNRSSPSFGNSKKRIVSLFSVGSFKTIMTPTNNYNTLNKRKKLYPDIMLLFPVYTNGFPGAFLFI